MACINCRGDITDARMPCAVCVLNNDDASEKRVKFCDLCGAYICADHWDDPVARTVAFVKKYKKKLAKLLMN